MEDIFDVQDQIALAIVSAIDPAVRSAALEAAVRVHPDDLGAWDRVQRGASEFFRYRPDGNIAARAHFEAAIAIDGDYAAAHSWVAWTYAMEAWLNWTKDPAASTELGYRAAKAAFQLDDRDAASFGALAMANYAMGRLDGVRTAADRSNELNPSYPPGLMMAATARIHGGEAEAGVAMVTTLLALSPQDPAIAWFYGLRAIANFILENLPETVADARAAVKHRYGYLFGRLVLTAALTEMSDIEEARSGMDEILVVHPDFSLRFLHPYTFADERDRQRLVDGLRAARFEG